MQEHEKKDLRRLAEKAAHAMELPVLFSESEIRMAPSQGICICGIVETKEFSSDCIVFALHECNVRIHGEDLTIACCENGMAMLHGAVLDVSFFGGELFVC